MKKITASEGKYLTQKTLENENTRVFVISVYLADIDAEENWREATQEEYYNYQRKRDEEMDALLHSDVAAEDIEEE